MPVPPVPVMNVSITMPSEIPGPAMVWPTVRVPVVTLETVSTPSTIEPVNDAALGLISSRNMIEAVPVMSDTRSARKLLGVKVVTAGYTGRSPVGMTGLKARPRNSFFDAEETTAAGVFEAGAPTALKSPSAVLYRPIGVEIKISVPDLGIATPMTSTSVVAGLIRLPAVSDAEPHAPEQVN